MGALPPEEGGRARPSIGCAPPKVVSDSRRRRKTEAKNSARISQNCKRLQIEQKQRSRMPKAVSGTADAEDCPRNRAVSFAAYRRIPREADMAGDPAGRSGAGRLREKCGGRRRQKFRTG